MQDLPPKPATYDDLVAAPPHLVAEIIGGRLVTHPRPAPRQTNCASVLGAILMPPFQLGTSGPGGWWIHDERELHLDKDILVPDLAGWRRDRMPRLPDTAWFEIVPDWVCEVLSPSTMRYDRGEKRDIYGVQGVRHLWHVDVASRLLELFELTGGRWVLLHAYRDADKVAAPPFDVITFDLAMLWDD